jgi:hypothetical protein
VVWIGGLVAAALFSDGILGGAAACRRAGMDGHVGKPIQIGILVETMASVLATPRAVAETAVG